ncbi:MAG: hypothetical protein QHH75_14925 [Bacillota bacterium]|nr:hypothetical protein [Bacillota bacterium]
MQLREEVNTAFEHLIELAERTMESLKQEVRDATDREDYNEVQRLGRRLEVIQNFIVEIKDLQGKWGRIWTDKELLNERKISFTRGDATLRQILEVTKLMWYEGRNYTSAVNEVAERLGIKRTSVLDKTTRRIGLRTTEEFRKLLQDRSGFIRFLVRKFPHQRNLIETELLP